MADKVSLLNKYPKTISAISILFILGYGAWMLFPEMAHTLNHDTPTNIGIGSAVGTYLDPKKPPNLWFMDPDTGKLTVAPNTVDSLQHAAGGHPGIRARVFACGACNPTENRFVGWLEKEEIDESKLPEGVDATAAWKFATKYGTSSEAVTLWIHGGDIQTKLPATDPYENRYGHISNGEAPECGPPLEELNLTDWVPRTDAIKSAFRNAVTAYCSDKGSETVECMPGS